MLTLDTESLDIMHFLLDFLNFFDDELLQMLGLARSLGDIDTTSYVTNPRFMPSPFGMEKL